MKSDLSARRIGTGSGSERASRQDFGALDQYRER
jgi:hypothetical protein